MNKYKSHPFSFVKFVLATNPGECISVALFYKKETVIFSSVNLSKDLNLQYYAQFRSIFCSQVILRPIMT